MLAQVKPIITDSLEKYSFELLEKKLEKKSDFISYYEEAFMKKAKKENNITKIIEGYFYISRRSKDISFQLKCNDSAIAIAKKYAPEKLSFLYWCKGNILFDKKSLIKALDAYLTANAYTMDSESLKYSINFKIGSIKCFQNNHLEAESIFIECVNFAQATDDKLFLRYVLGLAELYNRIDKIDASEKMIRLGLDSIHKHKGKYLKQYFIKVRAENLFKRGKFDLAIKDFKQVLSKIRNNDFSNYAETSYFIGECYRKKQQVKEAISYYQKVDSIFVAEKDIYPIVMPAYEHLINYYKKQEDYNQALYFTEQFIKADKQVDENYKYITSNIAKKYDIQNAVSSKQNLINNLKNKEASYHIIVYFLIAGILLLFVFYLYNNKHKKNELKKQQALFEAYKKERELKTLQKTEENNHTMIKKTPQTKIDEKVYRHILKSLEIFENEKQFLVKDFTIELLASQLQINSKYISRVINEIKGCNYNQYINQLKIEYILDKLENEPVYLRYNNQGLSDSSGFSNVQTFARAFKAYTNMNPYDFIKELNRSNI